MVNETRERLVETVHKELANFVAPGSWAIDATVGNGYDTLFIAKHVGPSGQVIGMDIQQIAIEKTQQLLKEHKLEDRVKLYQMGHEHMLDIVPESWVCGVQVIMFNLGYCPGGDKTLITQVGTTLQALESALELLAFGGGLSIVLYPGHPGGDEEAQSVRDWVGRLEAREYDFIHKLTANKGPEWLWIQKKFQAV